MRPGRKGVTGREGSCDGGARDGRGGEEWPADPGPTDEALLPGPPLSLPPLDISHPASLQPTPHPPVPCPLPLPGHSGEQRVAANVTDTYNVGKF